MDIKTCKLLDVRERCEKALAKAQELQSKLLTISGQIYKLIEFLKNNQNN